MDFTIQDNVEYKKKTDNKIKHLWIPHEKCTLAGTGFMATVRTLVNISLKEREMMGVGIKIDNIYTNIVD